MQNQICSVDFLCCEQQHGSCCLNILQLHPNMCSMRLGPFLLMALIHMICKRLYQKNNALISSNVNLALTQVAAECPCVYEYNILVLLYTVVSLLSEEKLSNCTLLDCTVLNEPHIQLLASLGEELSWNLVKICTFNMVPCFQITHQ